MFFTFTRSFSKSRFSFVSFARLSHLTETDELTCYRKLFSIFFTSKRELKTRCYSAIHPHHQREKRENQQQLTARTALKIEENEENGFFIASHIISFRMAESVWRLWLDRLFSLIIIYLILFRLKHAKFFHDVQQKLFTSFFVSQLQLLAKVLSTFFSVIPTCVENIFHSWTKNDETFHLAMTK